MLPGGTDPLYRRVLAAGHTHYTRVEVWSHSGVRLDTLLPLPQQRTWLADDGNGLVVLDGSVQATLTSRVSRTAQVVVPAYMYPFETTDLLAPFGNELRIYHGLVMGDGSQKYVWQVFTGRIRDVSLSSDGTCLLQCSDRAADVADVNFVSPQNSVPGNTVNEEFQRLVLDAVPNAAFGDSDTFAKVMEALTWEFDRSSALDEIARSVGALWYPLADGRFVIRRFPWTVSLAPSTPLIPVVEWSDTEDGIVNSWQVKRSRDSIFNVVTVTGERLNGDAPVYATASDTTTGSPTDINGNFGVKSLVEKLQSPATQGGAQAAAEALLRTYISPVQEWTLGIVPDAALELGDIGTVLVEGRSDFQVSTGFNLPLGVSGDMSVSTISLVVGIGL